MFRSKAAFFGLFWVKSRLNWMNFLNGILIAELWIPI